MYAHFFKARGNRYEIIITREPSLRGMYDTQDTGGNFVARTEVTGKKHARTVADDYSAVCWNF